MLKPILIVVVVVVIDVVFVKINTNRAEGRGANDNLFYLNSLSNFIVTRVIPQHEV